ncbi:hypothetical protein HPB51_000609 [Rhipicephalus microplus]|uniref:Uncharacterized protein n=1 Tax=Rhipicephalus microplus TaxID=6941 RepID=A0A9J6DXM6_RHIMP|nr:hypothetical protein HPB51_000609 [Rhipicephalus microplus]
MVTNSLSMSTIEEPNTNVTYIEAHRSLQQMRGSRSLFGCLPQTICRNLHAVWHSQPCYCSSVHPEGSSCGQAHQTGDKTCAQRYQAPHLLIYCCQEKAKLQQEQDLSTRISTQYTHPERQEVKPSDTHSRSHSPTLKRRGARSRSKQQRKNQPQELLLGSVAPEASDAPPPLQQRQPGLTLTTPMFGQKLPSSSDIRGTFVIALIPRNMHPEYNPEIGVDRAERLIKGYVKSTHVTYVDGAEDPTHRAVHSLSPPGSST